MMRLLLSLLLPGLLVLAPSACAALTYSTEPIEAWVIDAETKKPLEGVVVTANWQLEEGTFGGNVKVGQLMVMEAITDKNGQFYFPAWGPKRAPKGHLVNEDPQLLLFKSGYEYQRFANKYSSDRELRLRPQRRSDWHGQTIELKPFKGAMEEYARHLGFMGTSLETILSEGCGWKKIPRMILAVSEQSDIFRKRGIHELPSIESLEVRYSNFRAKCGSVKEFFRIYQP